MMTDSPHGLRIIFAGTPEFAATHLQGILDLGQHQVVAVYTQPDRPAGRGKKLTASPVKQLAEKVDLPVYQPKSLKDPAAQRELQALEADLMVVVAYGLLLPQGILDAPRLGCINVHASLLPRWRGAAPIQRAIEAGDKQTGVTIMQMDVGLDTGDMLLKATCEINEEDSAGSLHDKLANLGVPALNTSLSRIEAGNIVAEKQDDEQSCYAGKISKQEARITWQEPAAIIARKILAFNPFPIAFTELNNQRIKVYKASTGNTTSEEPGTLISADKNGLTVACGESSIILEHIQLPGGKALPVSDVLNAKASMFQPGTAFEPSTDNINK